MTPRCPSTLTPILQTRSTKSVVIRCWNISGPWAFLIAELRLARIPWGIFTYFYFEVLPGYY